MGLDDNHSFSTFYEDTNWHRFACLIKFILVFIFFFYIKSNIIQLTKKKQLTGHLEKNRP